MLTKYLTKETLQPLLKKLIIAGLLSLPVVLFLFSFAFTYRNGVLFGDWDYFAQLYEAARKSILEYNQFPWWNPWVAGGVPLYANPQFGLISIQMPLVLLFGTVEGLHLAVLIYFLLGFWGMYFLLRRLRPDAKWLHILLSYIWVFSGFPVAHIAGGHLTFAAYLLAPWLFLALLRVRARLGWLWLGLVIAFLINQSMHYMVVQMFLIGGLYVLYELFRRRREHRLSWWEMFKPYVLTLAVALPLSVHKVYYTFTYLSDYPRIPSPEFENSSGLMTAALSFRQPIDPLTAFQSQFGWWEYTAYFGVLSLALIAYLFFRTVEKGRFTRIQKLAVAGMVLFFLTAVGPFSEFSPYALLKELPVFEQMQVAARWLCWFVIAAIIFLLTLPKKRFVYVVLAISALDVFIVQRAVISYPQAIYTPPAQNQQQPFEQHAYYQNSPDIRASTFRYLHATQSNKGDTFGYEPIVQFGGSIDAHDFTKNLTIRCGKNQQEKTCPFVLSENARVVSWSPQRIVLDRTAEGDIKLNMNPGKPWLVNGKQLYPDMRLMELKKEFVIKDTSDKLTLEFRP